METTTPKTLIEAIKYFSDPDVCFEFAKKMNWPNGVECPYCGNKELSFIRTQKVWNCRPCGKRFSVRVGTIFESSRLPLETWFAAMWLVANAKNGISSCEVARDLGITQKTAWFLLHRIRHVMETGSVKPLEGEVECDETYIGGKARNMHAGKRQEMRDRGFPKTAVMGFKERDGEVRTMVIPDNTQATLQAKVRENVAQDADLFTDSAKGYNGLSEQYNHMTVDHKNGQYVIEHEDGTKAHTNGIEGYWNLLDRCYHGTYVIMSPQHQERYLAEQDFRYNTRAQRDGERFQKVAAQIVGKRLTYEELTTGHLQHIAPR